MAQALSQMYQRRVDANVPQPEMLPISVTDLAQRLSSSRETAHRLLKRLQGRGIVRTNTGQGTIEVLDREGLEALLYQLAEE